MNQLRLAEVGRTIYVSGIEICFPLYRVNVRNKDEIRSSNTEELRKWITDAGVLYGPQEEIDGMKMITARLEVRISDRFQA